MIAKFLKQTTEKKKHFFPFNSLNMRGLLQSELKNRKQKIMRRGPNRDIAVSH